MPGWDFEQLYITFHAQAQAVAANVYRAADPTGAADCLKQIMMLTKARKIVAAPGKLVDLCLKASEGWGGAIYRNNLRQHAEDADLGLSELKLAVAETGTLVQNGVDPGQRLVSALPLIHVALVPTYSLVPSLAEAMDWLYNQQAGLPGYISFITGPSRTADIERVLTIGAHGPKELHIIFVDRAGDEQNDGKAKA